MDLQSANKKFSYRIIFAAVVIAGAATFLVILNHSTIGNFLWNRFHFARAAVFFRRDAGLVLEMGNYYFNVGGRGEYDLKKADEYFTLAIVIDPMVRDAWHQRARIAFLKGDFKDALEKINTQIALHGDELMASYYIRGLIYGYDGQFDNAILDFKKFLSWDKNNWAAHNDLAWIYFQKGDYRKTGEVAERGLAMFPQNPWLLTMKGVALLNEGKRPDARKVLEQALAQAKALTPEDWQRAYPGNDPTVAHEGLSEMIKAIEFNVGLTVDK